MTTPRFFSLKWQIFTIVGLLSVTLLAGLFGYWQVTLNRAAQLGRAEEHKTVTSLIDTFYSQWQRRSSQLAEMVSKDQKLAMAVSEGLQRNRDSIEEYLLAHRFLTGATILIVSPLRGEEMDVMVPRHEGADYTVDDISTIKAAGAGVVCNGESRCWEVFDLPIGHQGQTVGTVTAAFPFNDFFKALQTAPYSTSIRVVDARESLPAGWMRLEKTLIHLPEGFEIAVPLPQQTPLEVVRLAIWVTVISGAVAFILLQIVLLTFLFDRLAHIKKIVAGIPMMLDTSADPMKLRMQLSRGAKRKFVDELDVISDAMIETNEALRLKQKVQKTRSAVSDDTLQLKLTAFLANARKLLLAKYAKKEEEMRRNLASDLHDEVGARLVSMKVDLSQLKQIGEISPEAKERIERFERNCKALNEFVHKTMEKLSPSILVDYGLSGAVGMLVDEWRGSLKGITEFKVSTQGDLHDLPSAQATAAYRIVQEALTNIAKHARAGHVSITLSRKASKVAADTIVIDIADDGVGFDSTQPVLSSETGGRGLQGIRDRAEGFGGSAAITSSPGKGTHIVCLLPVVLERLTLDMEIASQIQLPNQED